MNGILEIGIFKQYLTFLNLKTHKKYHWNLQENIENRTMNEYRQIKIGKDHTNREKEFYQIFPYQRPIKPQDYTLSKYLKENQEWLEEKGCSPEYQDESTTFKYLISFIEADIITIQDINCIPNTVGRTIIKINNTSKQRNEYFFTRRVVLQKFHILKKQKDQDVIFYIAITSVI